MPTHDLPVSLLKYGTPYAQDDPLLPPVGVPSDFISPSFLARPRWSIYEGLEQRMRADPFPIPAVVNREGYCDGTWEIDGEQVANHIGYWLSGYEDYRTTTAAAAAHGCSGGRVFDFGGGTGRVFRHFAAQEEGWDTWTSDFRLSSVRWNLLHFSPRVKALSNTSTPTLPLPDGYFDLVTAYSVFTHIDEPELQWLAELRRILKVGGLAFLTIHNEDTWRVAPRWRELFSGEAGRDLGETLPSWKTVSTWREDDPYNCNVFHGREYIERVWGSLFEIVQVTPQAVGDQAAVLCRRPD
ncbi:MAG: class I SAM-dependent methyltransferase [Pseudomonadota bacterium]|nr:class I SAM-dependent methyltransferase [Pseudomonadota bacterium]